MLLKLLIMTKNSSTKSRSKINFRQKSQRVHMSNSPKCGTVGLQRFAFLKYENALKWENSVWDWTLPKLRIITKIASNKTCPELNFLQKSQWVHMSTSPRSEPGGFVTITLYHNLSNMAIFQAPSSTPGNLLFWHCSALKWIYFPISVHYNVSNTR